MKKFFRYVRMLSLSLLKFRFVCLEVKFRAKSRMHCWIKFSIGLFLKLLPRWFVIGVSSALCGQGGWPACIWTTWADSIHLQQPYWLSSLLNSLLMRLEYFNIWLLFPFCLTIYLRWTLGLNALVLTNISLVPFNLGSWYWSFVSR